MKICFFKSIIPTVDHIEVQYAEYVQIHQDLGNKTVLM